MKGMIAVLEKVTARNVRDAHAQEFVTRLLNTQATINFLSLTTLNT
jgi:hypothetical protein